MRVAIVGLGLIGGSLAKAIKKNTQHSVFGLDVSEAAVKGALEQEAIDGEITADKLSGCDIVIVSLHPLQTIDFITGNKGCFRKGGIVIDTCGVKGAIISAVENVLAEQGVRFLGCHPMAGREFSGFAYSVDNLFEKASFIITPTVNTQAETIDEVTRFAYETGFARVVSATPQEHDEIIAYTSQLAHVVSSCYVKSPSLLKQSGFSAGSFKDLTRVAKLNEDMWTPLFLMNKNALVSELDCIIGELQKYREAIAADDAKVLHELLKEGRELKELSNQQSAEGK